MEYFGSAYQKYSSGTMCAIKLVSSYVTSVVGGKLRIFGYLDTILKKFLLHGLQVYMGDFLLHN